MDMRTPLRRCARSGLLQQLLCKQLLACAHAPQMWKGLRYQFVRVRVIGRLAPQTHRFGHDELRPDRIHDAIGDVILPAEDVGDRAIVPVGPDVNTLGGIDQLRGDPYAAAGLAYAAFENVPRSQLAAEFPDVDRLTFAGKGRVTIDNREPLLARQAGDDVLDNPVGKIRLLGIATDIVERQHNNRARSDHAKADVVSRPHLAAARCAATAVGVSATDASVAWTAPTNRKPRLLIVRMSFCWAPQSPTARRAALMRELKAASEIARPIHTVSISSSLVTIRS